MDDKERKVIARGVNERGGKKEGSGMREEEMTKKRKEGKKEEQK